MKALLLVALALPVTGWAETYTGQVVSSSEWVCASTRPEWTVACLKNLSKTRKPRKMIVLKPTDRGSKPIPYHCDCDHLDEGDIEHKDYGCCIREYQSKRK